MKSYRNPKTLKRRLINLQIYHGKIKESKYPKGAENVMELGAGKLNDLISWSKAGIKNVYAIDIDRNSIELGLKKYEKIKDRYKLPSVITKVADVTKDYKEIMKDLEKLKYSIDHIVCNFSIHYFLRDKRSINGLLSMVKFFLKIGGTFRFTTLDGYKIFRLFQTICKGEDLVKFGPYESRGNSIMLRRGKIHYFKIQRKFECDEKFDNFGQKIDVYVLSIGRKHSEYLVNISYLSKIFDGFRTDEIKPFKEFSTTLKKEYNRMKKIEQAYSDLNVYCQFTRIK